MPAPDPNVVDMDTYFKNSMVTRHEKTQTFLEMDSRALSGLLSNQVLAGSAQGVNLSAGIPNPGASPLKAT